MLNISTPKILVTGGTGFIGSYIVRYLLKAKYQNISVLKRPKSDISLLKKVKDRIIFIDGDINDSYFIHEIVENYDIILHTAAVVSYHPKFYKNMYRVNVLGTQNIINASVLHGIKKFVHISSIAALGRVKKDEIINESTIWQQSPYNTPYAKTKYAGEMEAWRGHAEGLNVTILNPSFVIGGGFWSRSSMQLLTKIKKGLNFYPIGGNGFVDVRDVAIATLKAMDEQFDGERFIISSQNLSYKELISSFQNHLFISNEKIKPLSSWKAELVIYLEKIRSLFSSGEPLLTRTSYTSSSLMSRYDHNKSIEKLHMKYRPLLQTIEETSACFKNSFQKGYGLLNVN